MQLLTFSSLFPNSLQERHGIFVEQRLRHLLATHTFGCRVVAPVPWFPLRSRVFGQYGLYAAIPRHERRAELDVWHPRWIVAPGVSWHIAPWLLFRACLGLLTELHRDTPIDLIDAHFFYPEGVAAVLLGRRLGIPVVVTARGSDLNLMPGYPLPRRWITWAANEADGLVTVSAALRGRLEALGVARERVRVLPNGVDLERFQPRERDKVRKMHDMSGPVLLSVGNLVELKGHHLVIEALARLTDCSLLVIGEGPERAALERFAASLGVAARVRFVGLVPQTELADYYSGADVLVLASSREGMPNVVLEALACGTPVVATRVGGVPEVVTERAAGLLSDERSVDGLIPLIRELLENPPARAATRAIAERHGWNATSAGQAELFETIHARRRRAGPDQAASRELAGTNSGLRK